MSQGLRLLLGAGVFGAVLCALAFLSTTIPAVPRPASPGADFTPPDESAGHAGPQVPARRNQIEFEVRDELTGDRIEADVRIDISDAHGVAGSASAYGRESGVAIPFNGAPGIAFKAVAHARQGGQSTESLFVVHPAVTQTIPIRVPCFRQVPVVISNAGAGEHIVAVVFAVAPPAWPASRLFSRDYRATEGAFTCQLPPGDYELVAYRPSSPPEPAERPPICMERVYSQRDIANLIDARGRYGTARFTVAARPQPVAVSLESKPRSCALVGRVVDAYGQPDSGALITVDMQGPASCRLRVAAMLADADGRFAFSGLPAGEAQVRASGVRGSCGKWLCLREGSPQSAELESVPRLPKGFIRYTGQRVGSIQVLCAGEPVPGARLHEVAGGRLENWASDCKVRDFGPAADAGGVVHPKANEGDILVTVAPFCGQVFEIPFSPGCAGRAVIDISPPGTGSLHLKLRPNPLGRFDWRTFDIHQPGHEYRLGAAYWSGGKPDLVVYGLLPGAYRVEERGGGPAEVAQITIEPDRMHTLDGPFPVRTIRSSTVAPCVAHGEQWPQILIPSKYFRDNSWTRSEDQVPRAYDGGFVFEQAPSCRLRLMSYIDGALCVAEIPAGFHEVKELQWHPVRTARFDEGGRLGVRVKVTAKPGDPIATLPRGHFSVEIRSDSLDWVRVEPDQRVDEGDEDGQLVFLRMPPGAWRVRASWSLWQSVPPGGTEVVVHQGKAVQVTLPVGIRREAAYRSSGAEEPFVLTPAPGPALPPPPPPDDAADQGRVGLSGFQIQVSGVPMDALWRVELRYTDHGLCERIGLNDNTRRKTMLLSQHEGCPILLWEGDEWLLDGAVLSAPGFLPVRLKVARGTNAVGVTMERE